MNIGFARTTARRLVALTAAIFVLSGPTARAMEETIVTATRVAKDELHIPLAIGSVDVDDVQRRQQLGLDESLNQIPGIFFQNRYNFAQDLRISIRGFGSRANFGIRGIKIFVDGIPSTTADGQAGTDDVDLGSTERIEVIRGPASALYGASSGGVINIYTEDGPERPFVEGSAATGEFEFEKYQFKTGGQYGSLNYLVNASYLELDGYRRQSTVEHYLINSKFRYAFDDGSTLSWVVNAVDSPRAEDAGGLTAAQAAADPRQTPFNNTRFDAGEALDQQKFGWVYDKNFGEQHHLVLRNYYVWRGFDASLPFPGDSIVEFERFFFGGGIQYGYTAALFGHANRLTVGIDVDSQEDDRQRYINSTGGFKRALSFDQLEEAVAFGIFFQNEFALTDTLELVLGGRYDMIDLDVGDRFLGNGDQTAGLDFDEFSPMVGLMYSPLREVNVYFNFSTSFETPTFTELAEPAQNGTLGGFANVTAQTADSFEVGIKGIVMDRLRYDLAVFTMDVEDEITSVTNVSGRSFFNNADTDRTGVEAGLVAELFEGLELVSSYTYSDFEFDKFTSTPAAVGSELPGLPEHQVYAELSYTHPRGFYAQWDILQVGRFFVDNENTVKSPSYHVSNLRVGQDFRFGAWKVSPYFGINNLFNEDYNQNVRINATPAFGNAAAGPRAFEPAPDRNIYGGLSMRYDFGS